VLRQLMRPTVITWEGLKMAVKSHLRLVAPTTKNKQLHPTWPGGARTPSYDRAST
jgi:hypothetical protein